MGRDSRVNLVNNAQVIGADGEPRRPGMKDAVDGLGRVLQPADAVFWSSKGEKLFRVIDVRPVMDPTVEPGMVAVDLICFQTVIYKGGVPMPNVVRVATAAEAPPMPITVQRSQPLPQPAPPTGAEGPLQ